MKKVLHWVWSFLEVVIVIYVIALTLIVLCKNKYGYTQFGDYSIVTIDSVGVKNIQHVDKGELLVVKNSDDMKAGDMIYYYAVFNDNYIVRSGVITDVKEDDFSAVYTIVTNDTPITVASTRVIGKYANTYENLGSILDVLESRVGFLFLVLLPIMVVFIYQLYEFFVILKYDEVEDVETPKKEKKKKERKTKEKKVKVKEEKKESTAVENTKKKDNNIDDEIL